MGEDIDELRRQLDRAARIADPVERAMEVVGVVGAAATPTGVRPVVVGGVAVLWWTARPEFATADVDLILLAVPNDVGVVVTDVTGTFADAIERLGFVRAKNRRHWELPGTDVFLEAPGSALDAGAEVVEVDLPSHHTAAVLSRVDLLLDRLDEFQAGGHRIVAQQIVVLLAGLDAGEAGDLDRRATGRRVSAALGAMRRLADDIRQGRLSLPETDELHAIARQALAAEYHGRGHGSPQDIP
jgi:hypothetical protein